MIAVTGSLAMNNYGPGADIDYLVVTTPGRVWIARLLLVALVRFARLSGVELCPNFILSTEVLCLHEQTFLLRASWPRWFHCSGLIITGR